MTKVSTNITLDPELKAAAQALLGEMGMDLSTAVTIFLKQMIRERAIPFTISLASPNAETSAALNEYYAMCENKAVYKRYNSFADVVKDAEKKDD
ncbi:MAG TPA: type II toxin-antitoxin system RelB/DinJ family antitoxin [Methanocorpusculum sp.]|nr:type II toxin-antitoxin system RelB/DinJ family antitoxin [Methanocorpusculum sp.]